MGIFDKAKGAVKNYTDGLKEQNKGVFDKAKGAVKNYTDGLKEQEAKNNELASASMEERIKMRPGMRFVKGLFRKRTR